MGNLLKQAQQMQREFDRVQAELLEETVSATSGGGAVSVEVNGDGQVLSVELSPELTGLGAEAAEALETLIQTAVSEGIARSKELRAERLGRITGGLDLPGLS
jgi:hypothetical protein